MIEANKVSGRLRFFEHNWAKYTNDPYILSAIKGYELEFDSEPIQYQVPSEIQFNKEEQIIVSEEVKSLLCKGAIIPTDNEPGQFISNLFIVPKPNGKFRPVINLKKLNLFVRQEHFKQETFNVVLDLVQEIDFFTSLDLRDAYFSIFVKKEFQRFLKFSWQGQLYTFVCVPFGYSLAPRLFTKILKPIYAWFRCQGFRCSYYIDDSINMDKDKSVCRKNALVMTETLESLGFFLNTEKSVLEPKQRIVYFGYILDSVLFKVFLPDKKIQKIKKLASCLLTADTIVIRSLASFIGLIINAFHAILEAPLHYRQLEREKISGLGLSMDFEQKIQISEGSRIQLVWWLENVEAKNGKVIRPKKPTVFLQSDASLMGWGAYNVSENVTSGGRWILSEAGFCINYLELLAMFHALRAFCVDMRDVHVSIQSDSTSAIAYLNHMGGIGSVEMDQLAFEIWQWCIHRNIFVTASFIAGISNVYSDYASRNFSDSTEWEIKDEIFQRLCDQSFYPDIDLFASRSNNKVERFVSWFPQPGAWRYDAFSFSWNRLMPYIFPPFTLISRILNKIIEDKVQKALLVVPHWTSQSWFPQLLSLIISPPIRIPRHKDLLILPHSGQTHPLAKTMCLVGVTVSGDVSRIEDFLFKLPTSSDNPGEREQKSNIHQHGRGGVFGTLRGKVIPSIQMK